MVDRRRANVGWEVAGPDGSMPTWERVSIAVLMDIRDELQKLNGLLHCPNFTGIPATLRRISYNTHRPRRKKAAR
jgi:hypothetical protein